ncbi:hypothetical protein E4U60_002308 [Claviceps pazoutovae]|uniref:Uncharacterized protein n=1 Tax=Claviceps pazoutovae TaxID=1649127 RepID=A0A9P7MBX9_9HYPO|nr:hypothetical protein E4U60_002308 [Claviceps pazoutovae]
MSLADQTADGSVDKVQGDASESKNGTIDEKGMRWEEDDDVGCTSTSNVWMPVWGKTAVQGIQAR